LIASYHYHEHRAPKEIEIQLLIVWGGRIVYVSVASQLARMSGDSPFLRPIGFFDLTLSRRSQSSHGKLGRPSAPAHG
jgi:hypothetical protein